MVVAQHYAELDTLPFSLLHTLVFVLLSQFQSHLPNTHKLETIFLLLQIGPKHTYYIPICNFWTIIKLSGPYMGYVGHVNDSCHKSVVG